MTDKDDLVCNEIKVNNMVQIEKTICLLSSMVRCGEDFTESSLKMKVDALINCEELYNILDFCLAEIPKFSEDQDFDVEHFLIDLKCRISNFIGQ